MEYITGKSLKEYNSFKTEASAKLFAEPKNAEELIQCLNDYSKEKKLVIGGGCNMFFTKDFNGLVIHPQLKGMREASSKEDDDVFIEVMASEDWDDFVKYTVEKGFSGLENLSLIPGTVGASPVQNIGAYGAEVKDCIREVVAIDIDSCEIISLSNQECKFGYRDSIFKQTNKYIILSVIFHLKRTFNYIPKYFDLNKELEDISNPTIMDVRNAVINVRKRKLPDEKVLPNCGSFFKNPYITIEHADKIKHNYPDLPSFPFQEGLIKTSAAFLIDKAGYKGKRNGNIGTYPNQPLIIVNYGTDDGTEIVDFMKEIKDAVNNKFGIMLEPEVWIF